MNATRPYWWEVNIGSGNGLVQSGNQPLSEPMLTQICCQMASLGFNELILAGISNHMPSKVWDDIAYLFPNFNSLGMDT